MQYAQLNPDNSYGYQITAEGNVRWDDNHFCPASALTQDEAVLFRVVPLLETFPPVFDSITQSCQRDGGELVSGQWQYKWIVLELSADALASNLAAAKAAKWEEIKAKRDQLSNTGGYKVVIDGVDKWFHSNEKSKTQQLGLVVMGAAANNVPPWKTMDGTKVPMSQTLAGQIFQAAAVMDGTLFTVADAHNVAMEASNTPSTYDYSTGWPATYADTLPSPLS